MKSTRVCVITQARTTSTRLPGKVLLPLGGESVLACHARRVTSTGLPLVVATTVNRSDDPIVEMAASLGLSVYRGNEGDVLSRYSETARAYDIDVVVRVTSDCPLVDGDLIVAGVDTWLELNDPSAFLSNTLDRTYPRGLDFEIFSAKMLHMANRDATSRAEREHVTPYLYANPASGARLHQVVREEDASNYRLTLDTDTDYRLLSALVNDHNAGSLDAEGLISLLDQQPELAMINQQVTQKHLEE